MIIFLISRERGQPWRGSTYGVSLGIRRSPMEYANGGMPVGGDNERC